MRSALCFADRTYSFAVRSGNPDKPAIVAVGETRVREVVIVERNPIVAIFKFILLLPLFVFPIGLGVELWKRLAELELHPALIVLAMILTLALAIGVIVVACKEVPRIAAALGMIYFAACYGLTAYSFTHDRIWGGVIGFLALLLAAAPILDYVKRQADQ
jgi:hypothetical protein